VQFKQKLQQDMREAIRVQDQQRVNVIRMLLAAFERAQEMMGREAFETANTGATIPPDRHQILNEQAIKDILRDEVQRRREAADILRAGRQTEQAESEEADIAILEGYLANV
jgi:uncharacterized protein YqeY